MDLIMDQLVEQLDAALARIPTQDKSEYLEACARVPELVRTETDHTRYLRAAATSTVSSAERNRQRDEDGHDDVGRNDDDQHQENHHAKEAALRIVCHWRHRKRIFGERAWLAMNQTGRGALSKIDAEALRRGGLVPIFPAAAGGGTGTTGNYVRHDSKGDDGEPRTVLCWNRARFLPNDGGGANANSGGDLNKSELRCLFYVMFVLSSELYEAQTVGIRTLYVLTRQSSVRQPLEDCSHGKQYLLQDLLHRSFPFRSNDVHVACIPPLVGREAFLKLNVPNTAMLLGEGCAVHVPKNNDDDRRNTDGRRRGGGGGGDISAPLLTQLTEHGFDRDGLPVCVGGTLRPEKGARKWCRDRLTTELERLLARGRLAAAAEIASKRPQRQQHNQQQHQQKKHYDYQHQHQRRPHEATLRTLKAKKPKAPKSQEEVSAIYTRKTLPLAVSNKKTKETQQQPAQEKGATEHYPLTFLRSPINLCKTSEDLASTGWGVTCSCEDSALRVGVSRPLVALQATKPNAQTSQEKRAEVSTRNADKTQQQPALKKQASERLPRTFLPPSIDPCNSSDDWVPAVGRETRCHGNSTLPEASDNRPLVALLARKPKAPNSQEKRAEAVAKPSAKELSLSVSTRIAKETQHQPVQGKFSERFPQTFLRSSTNPCNTPDGLVSPVRGVSCCRDDLHARNPKAPNSEENKTDARNPKAPNSEENKTDVTPPLGTLQAQPMRGALSEFSPGKGLKQLEQALGGICASDKAALLEANWRAPHLIELESDPMRYLRYEDGNASAAARRLCGYWKMRKSFFGIRAFLPLDDLSGQGALCRRDVEIVSSGAFAVLPDDALGRRVFCLDGSRLIDDDENDGDSKRRRTHNHCGSDFQMRALFYALSAASWRRRRSEQDQHSDSESDSDCVFLFVCGGESSHHHRAVFQPFFFERFCAMAIVEKAPVLLRAKKLHLLNSSSSAGATRRNVFASFLPRFFQVVGDATDRKNIIVVHVAETERDLGEELKKYGLPGEGLPPRLGGKWTYDSGSPSSWIGTEQVIRRSGGSLGFLNTAACDSMTSRIFEQPQIPQPKYHGKSANQSNVSASSSNAGEDKPFSKTHSTGLVFEDTAAHHPRWISPNRPEPSEKSKDDVLKSRRKLVEDALWKYRSFTLSATGHIAAESENVTITVPAPAPAPASALPGRPQLQSEPQKDGEGRSQPNVRFGSPEEIDTAASQTRLTGIGIRKGALAGFKRKAPAGATSDRPKKHPKTTASVRRMVTDTEGKRSPVA